MMKNSHTRYTLNPATDTWQKATWIPNWKGTPGRWVVRFPGQRGEVDAQKENLQTKNG